MTYAPDLSTQLSETPVTGPALHALSLGAGVQSTTLLLLSAEGRLPKYDVAIFADTGWEPRAVYEHLDRIEREVAQPAGIPIVRVRAVGGSGKRSTGDLRADSLRPDSWMRMPVFVPDRTDKKAAMVRRQCTDEYKLVPFKQEVRRRLGYEHPRPVPRGMYALSSIGISRDEFHRAKDAHVQYLKNEFPLLHLDGAADGREGWTRNDCIRYLNASGWSSTPKSACIGCPFHGNRAWRALRDTCSCGHHRDDHRPGADEQLVCAVLVGGVVDVAQVCSCQGFSAPEWDDAVAFDREMRETTHRGIKKAPYLHRSLLPLADAPIDKVTRGEWNDRQVDLFDAIADQEAESLEEGEYGSCSPWSCRSEEPA
jgi:3'-phosphoadenosine 5'-phosphosulfate sulfotransferase (PAPS reductase)/FAD synthetase